MAEVAIGGAGGVRTLCIDRESKPNALNRTTLLELEAAFEAAGGDPEVLTSRTEDAHDGISAFFEKREPVWKGR